MIRQDYDLDADALYIQLTGATVARTAELDSGTIVNLDSAGQVVGIEVIQPQRAWPLEEILTRFAIAGAQATELRAYFPQPPQPQLAPEHPAPMPPRTHAQPSHPGPGVRVEVS